MFLSVPGHRVGCAFCVVGLSLLSLAGCNQAESAVPTSSPESAQREVKRQAVVSEVSPGNETLTYTILNPVGSFQISLSDFSAADTQCLTSMFFGVGDDYSESKMRRIFLYEGCAVLKEGKGSPEEISYQDNARSEKRGLWGKVPDGDSAQSPKHDGKPPKWVQLFAKYFGWLPKVGAWLVHHWEWSLGLILPILVTILGWRYKRYVYDKNLVLVLAGEPASGKTLFWQAFQGEYDSDTDTTPTTRAKDAEIMIPYGQYTLYSKIWDTSGSDASQMLSQLTNKPLMFGNKKRVLVVVLSPTPAYKWMGEESDETFVSQQFGAVNIISGLIKNKKFRPDLVICFASKFDLYSKEGPNQSDSNREYFKKLFAGHREKLQSVCLASNIPFKFIIGSSTTGWGIREANSFIANKLVSSRK